MAAIGRFEDLEAWQKARELCRLVYATSSAGELAKDFGLRDQIRRAAVSVMANIAEGFERGGDREFRQFLSTARGSVSELKSHLYVALDARFLRREEFDELYRLAGETERLIGGFMRYLATSRLKGSKLK